MKLECHVLRDSGLGGADVRASEFFRAQHGDDEIDEQAERDEADDDVFHGRRRLVPWRWLAWFSPKSAHLLAEAGVGGAQDEEGDGEGDEDEIVIHDPASIAPPGASA
jgi:hypothetical protein